MVPFGQERNSWVEFKYLIKKEYLPLDYQRHLKEEIRARVQGPNEPMGTYIAKMLGLFIVWMGRLGRRKS